MQKETAIQVERQKSSVRRWLPPGMGLFCLGLIGASCFATDPVHAQRIFRCEAYGRIIYGDQPCVAASSTEVVLQPTNSYHADPAPVSPPTRKFVKSDVRTNREADAIAAEQQRAKLNCQRLADQLANIENTMRSGYSAKQGEHLRERQRQLELRRRTERCR